MKRNVFRKALSIVLCISMVLSFTAFASAATANPGKVIKNDWTNFRGNAENNGVTSSLVPKTPESAMLYWASKHGTGWSAAPGSPILKDGYLYFNAGDEIIKMDAMSGEIVAKGQMVAKSAFSICPPTYAKGKIFMALSNGRIQAFDAKTLKSLWVYSDELKGQPNTPITYHKGHIYAGFWRSEVSDANFVCLSITDPNPKKSTEDKKAKWTHTSKGGFYWAGAYACDDFVLVGTDDGHGGYTSQTSNLLCFQPKTGKILDKITGLNADIRSNVSYYEKTDRYYFTSKGGSFYSVKVSKSGKISDLKSIDLGGMSTSTPAIYNGRAYVGVSGEAQFGTYGGHNITVIDLASWKIAYSAPTMGYPQTSGLVSTAYEDTDGYVYVYFFENYTPGKLRFIKDKPGQTKVVDGIAETFNLNGKETKIDTAPSLFTPQNAQAQYAICSPIVDEYGTIYFKNDSCHVMALGSKINSIEIVKKPRQSRYDIGDKANLNGIKVVAKLANGLTRDVSDYVKASDEPITEEQTDLTVFYPYSMYNDVEEAEPIYTTLDIKVNDKEQSDLNNASKKAIAKSKVSGLKVKAAPHKAKLSWKKITSASGYQISRALKEKGTYKVVKTTTSGSTVKYINKSLKSKKTYYYKVRAYKTVNGEKYYGKWSKIQRIKVK